MADERNAVDLLHSPNEHVEKDPRPSVLQYYEVLLKADIYMQHGKKREFGTRDTKTRFFIEK